MTSNNGSWVINTNSNTCRIYQYHRPDQLTLLKELSHPENKLRDIDLTSDKPGHYKTGSTTHGAYAQASDPKEIKIDEFSREIAKELDHGRNTQAYKKLIIIAPPHMNGLLNQHINKHVKELVVHVFEKDLIKLPDRELLAYLQANI